MNPSTQIKAETAVRPLALRGGIALILALAALMIFPDLHRGGLAGYDDAMFAHEGREMLQDGDWATVHYNGAANSEYLPGFIWMEAVSMRIFGVNDFAAKLPAALAGLGTIAILYLLAVELAGDSWLALLSATVLAGTQFFLKYSTHAMSDLPFTFFFILAIFLYLKGLRQARYFWLAGLAVGCAILIRSILGTMPLGIMAAHLLVSRRYRLWPHWIAACAMALAPALLWIGLEYQAQGTGFLAAHLSYIFHKVDAGGPSPSRNLFGYLPALLKAYWPWLPFLVIGIWMSLKPEALRRDTTTLLPLLWFVLVIGPLSLAAVKYTRYLLPAFPAMSILSAIAVNRWIPQARRAVCFRVACAALLAGAVYAVAFPYKDRAAEMRQLSPVAAASLAPGQRIFLYLNGEQRFDYQNQILWYSGRHTFLSTDLDRLAANMAAAPDGTAIIDRASLPKLLPKLPPGLTSEVAAETQDFVCVRFQRAAAESR